MTQLVGVGTIYASYRLNRHRMKKVIPTTLTWGIPKNARLPLYFSKVQKRRMRDMMYLSSTTNEYLVVTV
jgi:hypothetical protein